VLINVSGGMNVTNELMIMGDSIGGAIHFVDPRGSSRDWVIAISEQLYKSSGVVGTLNFDWS
jgi:hypothetical protein